MGYVKQGRPQEQDWVDCQKQNSRTRKKMYARHETPPAPNSGRGLAQELQKNKSEGGLLITTTTKKQAETKTAMQQSIPQQPHQFTRRFGSTIFRVAVHMNPNSKETAEAKIARLVRMEADAEKAGGA